jgi:hypothetical protein
MQIMPSADRVTPREVSALANRRWALSCLIFALALLVAVLGARNLPSVAASITPLKTWLAFWRPDPNFNDSWYAMHRAFEAHLSHAGASLYEVTRQGVAKFQYPPSSLLLHAAVDAVDVEPSFSRLLAVSWWATAGTLLFTALLWFLQPLSSSSAPRWTRVESVCLVAATVACALMFYPNTVSLD